jgi:hypothetical protein
LEAFNERLAQQRREREHYGSFPDGMAYAELVDRPGLVGFTGPEDGVGKLRLIRTVGKMLGF